MDRVVVAFEKFAVVKKYNGGSVLLLVVNVALSKILLELFHISDQNFV